jgi:3-dehydroquinate synthase/shikimate kinase/3-dehydroquinate synthase
MKPIKLKVETKNNQYPIIIGEDLTNNLSKIFKKNLINFNKCFLLIDKKINSKKIKKITNSIKQKKIISKFNSSEKNKNINNIIKILNLLQQNNFNRNDCLIAVGGGITGDVGGFAASLFKRGLKFINIPTTLLAQVDSSVGGKTGVNTKFGKNLIGSFYQPCLVLADTTFLKTLPKREIVCGYAEILKHSIISNKKFFKYLNKNVENIFKLKSPYIEKAIFESCKIKREIVQKDENEKNLRKILNFGHTFGHAYEASMNYSKKLNHGEAVILGIYSALRFSLVNKIISFTEFNIIKDHLDKTKLSYDIKKFFTHKDTQKILSYMQKDKKNNSEKINLILLKKIGLVDLKKKFSVNQIKLFISKILKN